MVARKSYGLALPRAAALVRNELGKFSSHEKFIYAISRSRDRCTAWPATIPLNLLFSQMHSEQFAAMILAAMGAIYIGFGMQKGNRAQIATELTVGTGFFTAALAALWVTPWIVPVAYAAHGIWDYAHHQGSRLASIPSKLVAIPLWYPPFCAVYDWVAAASLAVLWGLRA